MKKYARLHGSVVVEIIDCDNIKSCYHPDFIATLVRAEQSVCVGMIYIDGAFVKPSVKKTTPDRIAEQYNAIDAHIQTCIKSRDFDDIGQVAMCCVDGNGYQIEALAISAWIRECWKIQEAIKTGKLVCNDVGYALSELPKFDILD